MKNLFKNNQTTLKNKVIVFFFLLHVAVFYFFHFNHFLFGIPYAGDNYSNIFDIVYFEQFTQDQSYIDNFLNNFEIPQLLNDNTIVFKFILIRIIEYMPFASGIFLQFLIMFMIYIIFIKNILLFKLNNKDLIIILAISLLPTFNYWTCYVSKTSVVTIAINLVFLFILNLFLRKKISLFIIFLFLLGLLILFFLKQTYLFLLAYLILNVIILKLLKDKKIISLISILLFNIPIVVVCYYLPEFYSLICNIEMISNNFCNTKLFSYMKFSEDLSYISNSYNYGNTSRDINLNNIKEIMLLYPYYFYLSFFGPAFYEINNPYLLFLYIEKIILFFLIIIFLKEIFNLNQNYLNLLIYLLIFILIFFIFTFPYTIQSIWNIGSSNRYRAEIFLPFIYFLILYKNKIVT